jgi:hypothetical protein
LTLALLQRNFTLTECRTLLIFFKPEIMKKSILHLVSIVFVSLTSCSTPHFYYLPNIQNVPAFSEKNIFTGQAAGSFSGLNNCFEIQTGYSLPGHVALTANFMTGGNHKSLNTLKDNAKYNYFEGAAGYYRSFLEIGVFEVYAGYGHGNQHHVFSYSGYDEYLNYIEVSDGNADMTFSKVFIQPDIGVKYKWMTGALSLRLARINFININSSSVVHHDAELNNLSANNPYWLIEPALTFRGGFEQVKLQLQLAASACPGDNENLWYEPFRISLGLFFSLGGSQPSPSPASDPR